MDMTMAFTPDIGKMKAFGLTYAGEAEKIKPLAPKLEP
jgi:hypothetical protein